MNNEIETQIRVLEQDLAEERHARQALVEASVRLNSMLNLPDLLNAIMQTATELLHAETSSLMLLDEKTNELTFAAATHEPSNVLSEIRVPASQGLAGWVLQHDEIAIVDDVANDPRFYPSVDQATGFMTRSMLALPLKIRDRIIGVVEVINKRDATGFSARDQDLALALASLAAVAADNARLYQKLADAVVESRMSYRL